MTQNQRIVEYIEKYGSISQLEALRDLGVMRLASRISDLKKQGYAICSFVDSSENRFGEKVCFKRYKFF